MLCCLSFLPTQSFVSQSEERIRSHSARSEVPVEKKDETLRSELTSISDDMIQLRHAPPTNLVFLKKSE